MSDLPDDNSLQETLKAAFDASQMADDIEERKQTRKVVQAFCFRLYDEERTLKKAKQSAEEKGNSTAYQLAQSKLDFVNELLSIGGLEELAHLLYEPEQPSDFVENTEPLKKVEQRLLFMKGVISGLDYDSLEIPTGGKQQIMLVCLKEPTLFTESTFDAAWKEARSRELVKMADHEKFI